ncbi:MAG: TolC family protein [Salinivirgaceae bacterium]|nr:TolC family protein [Salinivirgaceae bacterium]
MKSFLRVMICLVISSVSAQAEETAWTLNQCLKHAISNNLQLKISENEALKADYVHTESQWAVAPSVYGSANTNMNFKRATDQDNRISSGNSYNINYGIGAQMTLFAGFQLKNQMTMTKFNKLACDQSTISATNSLIVNVASLYATALYQKSLAEVADSILDNNMNERTRIANKVSVGQLQRADLSEIDATLSTSKLNSARSHNNYNLSLLQLAQSIELESAEGFSVAQTDFDLIEPHNIDLAVDSIYNLACSNYPNVLQCEYELNYYQSALKVAKGAVYPTITASANLGSSYYSSAVGTDSLTMPFADQARNFSSPSIGLSLNIPIFNGRHNQMQIKRSKVDLQNALYRLENQKKMIRKEIEEAILLLNSYYLEYESAKANVTFVEQSYDAYRQRYKLGLVTTTEFATTQNQLANAKAAMLQAKYMWIVQELTIRLFAGDTLSIATNASENE